MNSLKIRGTVLVALSALCLGTAPAFAQAPLNLTLQFLEVGSDVVGTASGALNRGVGSGLTPGGSTNFSGSVNDFGTIKELVIGPAISGAQPGQSYSGLSLLSGSGALVTGGNFNFASSGSGTSVGVGNFLTDFNLYVANAYLDGSTISSSSTFSSKTFSSLGMTPGKWVWGYGSSGNKVTVQIGPASGTTGGGGGVPEPGEWAAMGILGAGLTGLVIRKRKKA
jgi:hypothetical protein